MQLHRPIELLGTSWMLLAGLLVPLQQAAEAEGALQRRVVVVGSSVLLAGPADAVHIHSACWEYLNGSISRAVVQYDERSHYVAIHPPYVGRALFHPPNGSLLLEDLQESDSGIYKVTINLAERESLKVLLDVLKPVSRPQLWSSGLVAKATGEVLCKVVEGRVDTITWKKDGQALPRGRGFHVSGSLSILHLRAVKKSDCGSYSCNASNGISWQETSLNVTVAGLSPPLKNVLRIVVVAVVFAAVSGWGLVFPVCQSEKLRISPSIAIILPEIVLLYVIVVTFLVAANVTFQPTKLIQLKSTTEQRTMGYTAPGGVLLVVLTSSFHIKNIHHRHEDGCTAFVDVTALAVSTAAVSALPLLAIFLCYHTTQGWQNERDSSCAEKERSSRSFEMSLPNIKDPVPTC
uniref:Ig-like domain-containing protein n=1 Tax=Cairina moschata TaxID=8855 RepID=A0A8C3B7Y5_CAIMO